MTKKLGVVMDPIHRISYHKDTTLTLLLEAARRGWALHYMEPDDLYVAGGAPGGRCRPLQVFADEKRWYALGEPSETPLSDLDVILMRQDPPVDSAYLYNLMVLQLAEREGTLVVNRPGPLMERNEKLFALRFPDLVPDTLVSSDPAQLHHFIDDRQDVILKPLDGMGGTSIFRVRADDPNRNVIVETLVGSGQRLTMAQRFLPEIKAGDKRVLMIDGEPVPYGLARIPREGETRGNLAAGGTGQGFALGEAEWRICAAVGPVLRDEGIFFAGLDVIGNCLTEINITSPTCVQEINRAFSLRIEAQLFDTIEQKLGGTG